MAKPVSRLAMRACTRGHAAVSFKPVRKRMIDPAFWTDTKINELSIPARLLYIGLWQYADDEGFFIQDPLAIKRTLFPDQKFDIQGTLTECSRFFKHYKLNPNGEPVCEIAHFLSWQKINRPSPSKLKPFCTFTEDSLNTHGGLTEYSRLREEKLREEKLRERNNTSHPKSMDEPWPSPYLLIEKYNSIVCDDLPAIEKITPARIKKANEYLKLFPEESFWTDVFEEINKSSFLRGKSNGTGHPNFKANFDWLLTKGKDGTENVAKVFEGRYRNGS